MEIVGSVAPYDASNATVAQSLTYNAKYQTKNADGTLNPYTSDQGYIGTDGPSAGFLQNTQGQGQIFWLDAPGCNFTGKDGKPIVNMTEVQNLTSSMTINGQNCNVTWFIRTVVSNSVLDTTHTVGGFGAQSLVF